MSKQLKSVLLVEDDSVVHFLYKRAGLHEKFSVSPVYDLKSLWSLTDHHKFDAVVLDACLEERTPDTIPFIQHLRQMGYTGPIIPNSSDHNETLVRAGCNPRENEVGIKKHGSKLEGKDLVAYLNQILRQHQTPIKQPA